MLEYEEDTLDVIQKAIVQDEKIIGVEKVLKAEDVLLLDAKKLFALIKQ